MSTTIQVDKKTKLELFQLKNKMERELGRAVSYNEVIQILVAEKKKHPTHPKKNQIIRELRGILPVSALKEYRETKSHDLQAENHE